MFVLINRVTAPQLLYSSDILAQRPDSKAIFIDTETQAKFTQFSWEGAAPDYEEVLRIVLLDERVFNAEVYISHSVATDKRLIGWYVPVVSIIGGGKATKPPVWLNQAKPNLDVIEYLGPLPDIEYGEYLRESRRRMGMPFYGTPTKIKPKQYWELNGFVRLDSDTWYRVQETTGVWFPLENVIEIAKLNDTFAESNPDD